MTFFDAVVDSHGSIARGLSAGDEACVLSELGWTRIDELHRLILDGLLPQFGLAYLSELSSRPHLVPLGVMVKRARLPWDC